MQDLDQAPFPTIDDAARLIAEIKAGDENSRRKAYRAVFGGPIGQYVLADMVKSAGVGQPVAASAAKLGGADIATTLAYLAGQNDLALEIAGTAGFGPAALAVLILSDNLEGQEHDDRSGHEPEPEFD